MSDQLIEASREKGIEFTLEELQYVVANNDRNGVWLTESVPVQYLVF